jgi:hypothetical protein
MTDFEATAAASAARAPAIPGMFRRGAEASGPAASGRVAVITLLLAVAAINLAGASYYVAALPVRVRHPLHVWLKPTGHIGQMLGLAAALLFLFLWLYPIRKMGGARLAFTGSLASWLQWHVAAGLSVPWLAATHAGWRFTGLIGLGYGAMFIVYLSGLVGRYLYARIPRRRDGLELSRDEAAAERERLLFELTARTGLPPDEVRRALAPSVERCEGMGFALALWRMAADDRARIGAARALARRIPRRAGRVSHDGTELKRVLHLARREMALSQQLRMVDATQRAFKHWHAAHKPVAVTALLAVLAHIAVAVIMGATWLH